MSRQYIGARYVPRFRGLHNNTTIYDALDVVDNGSGTSYIARKTVPAGIALTNTEYWFVYGASSGAILDLQSRMTAAEEQLTIDSGKLAVLGNDDLYARLHGKKIIVLGDSLTEGSGSAYHKTWVEKIATKYGADCVNAGLSGSPIGGSDADSMISRIDTILAANPTCDIFVISGGANDKNRSIQPGSAKSEATITTSGALKQIVYKVRAKYGEDCRILAMTTYHRYNDYNTAGYTEYDYVQAVLSSCAYCGVPCFNNYESSGVLLVDDIGSSNAWMDVGYVDGGVRSYHFSEAAYDYMTPIYASYLATGLANNNSIAPNYLNDTDNGAFYYRICDLDGFGRSIMHKYGINFSVTDLGNHIALLTPDNYRIPKEYAIKTITNIKATIVIDAYTVIPSVLQYAQLTNGDIQVRVGGIIVYGSTAPTSPQTGRLFLEVDGILLQ